MKGTQMAAAGQVTLARPAFTLKDITSKGNQLPNRYGLHGLEGWGKTSFAAQFPKPLFIQTRGETGLETLIDAGRLPETPHLPEVTMWNDLRAALRMIANEKHDFKTLVIDTINGAERLCFEEVLRRDCEGSSEKFLAYGRGPEIAAGDWRVFLQDLDEVRQKQRMIIILLIHTKVTKFKNPEGSDFDRYQPELHAATWSLTHKWLDVVLFGNFLQTTAKDSNDKRQKGVGGDTRIMYCTRTAAWDAKNRIGLPPEIDFGGCENATEAHRMFTDAVKAGRGTVTNTTTGDQQ
jgi:hypothetical protein